MNKFAGFVFVGLLIGSVTISCRKQAPQLPSNKVSAVDTNALFVLEMNKELALKEDSILKVYVSQSDALYEKDELGFWYRITKRTNGVWGSELKNCSFDYKMKLLNGEVLLEESKQAVLGRKELIVGLEEGLKLLRKGDEATFIIPWYLAHGMKGDETLVPPYTSLIYEVKIN
jgi:FKBP-type peptidyl-prolyl cis-trans isomerase